jgi:hypothetical protein
MRPLESKSERVTIADGSRLSVALKVIAER